MSNNNTTIKDHSFLSNIAYADGFEDTTLIDGSTSIFTSEYDKNKQYQIIADSQDDKYGYDSGFQGLAIQELGTKNIFISYREQILNATSSYQYSSITRCRSQ